jgi:hypothetical protein
MCDQATERGHPATQKDQRHLVRRSSKRRPVTDDLASVTVTRHVGRAR